MRPKEISYFGLGERESKYGQERREKKGRRRRRRRLQVWNLSMDTCLGLYGTCLVSYGKVSIVYNGMELCGFSLESLDT